MTERVLARWHDTTLPRLELELVDARPEILLIKSKPTATGRTLPPEVRYKVFPSGRAATSSPLQLRRLAVLIHQAADELAAALGDTGPVDLFDSCCIECGADLDTDDHDPDCPDQYLEPLIADVAVGEYL